MVPSGVKRDEPMNVKESRGSALMRKPALATMVAGLLLVSYICFLVISNYRSQIALQASALNRYRLNLEKRVSSLGYFLSERKYDLSTLARSREISTYFINRALGMSEQYGLKVNLFMVDRVLRKTLEDKYIQGDRIYSRFIFSDASGFHLVDTATLPGSNNSVSQPSIPKASRDEPYLYMIHENEKLQILMASPCYYKGKIVGELTVWLDCETLFAHFVNSDETSSLSGSGLVDGDGRLLSLSEMNDQNFASYLTPERISSLSVTDFSFFPFFSDGKKQKMLVAHLPIHNIDVSFAAWIPSRQIVGDVAPWHLVIGMGFLAVIVLAGLGLIMWFTTQHLILKVRFDESERQHDLLAAKNFQLKEAIQQRKEAEMKLEAQRTLRMRSDRLRSLGEMAAGIAHELNQPLVGVRGFAELILDSIDNNLEMSNDQIRGNAALIVEQADRMVHIINHVRLFARDAGSIETSRVDLNEVVRSGITLLTAQFNSHGLSLEKELSPQELPVKVNPFSVEEVIFNLLSNARHSVEYKKEIAGEAYNPCVRVTTAKVNENCREEMVLTVTDNGTGIPGDVAGRIFDPFFTTKAPDQGTGLGLSICKSIVESFHGQIRLVATETRETSFEIRFPGFLK